MDERDESIDKASLEWMPKNVWGPIKWRELHARGLCKLSMRGENKWFKDFIRGLPCPDCRHHFEAFVRRHPPVFTSRRAFFSWTVKAHNCVNRATGKPVISVAKARALHFFEEEEPAQG